MQARAEHHEHDANLGQLVHGIRIADEARRKWAHHEPANKIAHDGRQAKRTCHNAAGKCRDEREHKGHKQNGIPVHISPNVQAKIDRAARALRACTIGLPKIRARHPVGLRAYRFALLSTRHLRNWQVRAVCLALRHRAALRRAIGPQPPSAPRASPHATAPRLRIRCDVWRFALLVAPAYLPAKVSSK